MSRIGKKPITLPAKVSVTINSADVTVKGPKGELHLTLPPEMSVKQEGNELLVERPSDARHHRALHGLTRALLANNVNGVSTGFRRTLKIAGADDGFDSRREIDWREGVRHRRRVSSPCELPCPLQTRAAARRRP